MPLLSMLAFMSVSAVPYQGYEERVFEAERRSDGEHWVEASKQSSEQDQFASVWLYRETSQVDTQRCQILSMVQGILTHHVKKSRRKIMSSVSQYYFKWY